MTPRFAPNVYSYPANESRWRFGTVTFFNNVEDLYKMGNDNEIP